MLIASLVSIHAIKQVILENLSTTKICNHYLFYSQVFHAKSILIESYGLLACQHKLAYITHSYSLSKNVDMPTYQHIPQHVPISLISQQTSSHHLAFLAIKCLHSIEQVSYFSQNVFPNCHFISPSTNSLLWNILECIVGFP